MGTLYLKVKGLGELEFVTGRTDAMLVISALHRGMTERLSKDERTYLVSGKALRWAVFIDDESVCCEDWPYRFPPNKRAAASSLYGQLDKLGEEFGELYDECGLEGTDRFSKERLLDESWDVAYAVEGLQRKFSVDDVEASRKRVLAKAVARGDVLEDR